MQQSSVEIPVEIMEKILRNLPIKSLGRFRCASKHWSSLIKVTIHRRSREEMRRRLHRSRAVRQSFVQLADEAKELVRGVDGLREFRDRLADILDEARSLARLDDIIDWYREEAVDGLPVDEMRAYAGEISRFHWLLDVVDTLVKVAGNTQNIASGMLELLEALS